MRKTIYFCAMIMAIAAMLSMDASAARYRNEAEGTITIYLREGEPIVVPQNEYAEINPDLVTRIEVENVDGEFMLDDVMMLTDGTDDIDIDIDTTPGTTDSPAAQNVGDEENVTGDKVTTN